MPEPTIADIARDMRMFGRNLCAAHERIGLTQPQFAQVSGYDRSTISRIECGRQSPKFETLLSLASASKTEPLELLTGVGPATSPRFDYNRQSAGTAVEQFGTNLRSLREAAGISHERLGEMAGADRSLISGWERGERHASLRSILKLARALDAPPALLLHAVSAG